MAPRVILVGPPGAGKTTVGRQVSATLDIGFRDTDADVEEASGRAVSEVFVDFGEEHFRNLERTAVSRALAEHDGVLALGGGAVLDPRTRADLGGYRVVFLDVGFACAARRIGLDRSRPLIADNPRAQLRRLLEERLPLYREIAAVTVSTDDRSVESVAADVLAALQ